MENKKLTNQQIDNIVAQLKVKQNNLKAVAALAPMLESCIMDYDLLINQVNNMREPTAKVVEKEEKLSESKKS